MPEFNNEKIIGLLTAVILLLVGSIVTYISQYKLKEYDRSIVRRKERENKKIKFYIPLLRNLYDIDDRFKRILSNLDKDWLSKDYLDLIKEKKGFAKDPTEKGYFIISSIYLIASFFGIYEATKRGVNITNILKKGNWLKRNFQKLTEWGCQKLNIYHRKNLFQFEPEINKISRLFQFEELFKEYMTSKKLIDPVDSCKLHKHIQNSIGEMMLIKTKRGHFRIKSFREFYTNYIEDEQFRFWFVLIENMFNDLSNFQKDKNIETKVEIKNDIRPLRIIAIQYWCRILMGNIAKELELSIHNYETRPAEQVLENLSCELKTIIKNYKLQTKDVYISGLNLKSN